jgi:septal ring factor EnvC (AmiA/AmiB activator)
MENQEIGKRIENAQKSLEVAEKQKTVLETQKTETERQLQAANDEVIKLGFNPETLEQDLAALELSMVTELDQLEKEIPKVDQNGTI